MRLAKSTLQTQKNILDKLMSSQWQGLTIGEFCLTNQNSEAFNNQLSIYWINHENDTVMVSFWLSNEVVDASPRREPLTSMFLVVFESIRSGNRAQNLSNCWKMGSVASLFCSFIDRRVTSQAEKSFICHSVYIVCPCLYSMLSEDLSRVCALLSATLIID